MSVLDGHVKIQLHVVTKPFHSVAVHQLEWFNIFWDYYKVCSSILRYYYTIFNIHYKLLLMKTFLLLQSLYFCRLTSKSSNNHHKNMKIATIKKFSISKSLWWIFIIISGPGFDVKIFKLINCNWVEQFGYKMCLVSSQVIKDEL